MGTTAGEHWQQQAVCALETPDAPWIWTPDRRPRQEQREHLGQMCQRCPVRRTCAAEAIEEDSQSGVYAGVWVPEQVDRAAWAAARAQLRLIAVRGEDDLAVSA